jgi:uncharacterized protein YndB with AHSA1/START domain
MDHLRIDQEVVIEAPVEVVWRTITEPDQITQWFANRVELDAKPGGTGLFVFDNGGGTPHIAPVVVEDVEPPSRFSFRWGHPDGADPAAGNSVLVEFTLVPEGNERTRLRVKESGLDVVAWPDDEKATYAEEHRGGWAGFLGRLVELLSSNAAQ